jgi:divinyl chlorophyllide a 8-vinyl-reductase
LPASQAYRSKAPADVKVVVFGPTGYIGRFVTKELIAQGYDVTAFAREAAGIKGKMKKEDTAREFEGARVVFGDVTDKASIQAAAFDRPADVTTAADLHRTRRYRHAGGMARLERTACATVRHHRAGHRPGDSCDRVIRSAGDLQRRVSRQLRWR